MNGPALKGRPPRTRPSPGSDRILQKEIPEFIRAAVVSCEAEDLAIEPPNGSLPGGAEPCRVLNQRLQDRVKIEGRAANHLEDFARRRLLVQRLREVAVSPLEFREQTHVLDGDDRLISEGLQQFDLPIAERKDSAPPHPHQPEGRAVSKQRYTEARSPPRILNHARPVCGVAADVRDMDYRPLQDRAAAKRVGRGGHR